MKRREAENWAADFDMQTFGLRTSVASPQKPPDVVESEEPLFPIIKPPGHKWCHLEGEGDAEFVRGWMTGRMRTRFPDWNGFGAFYLWWRFNGQAQWGERGPDIGESWGAELVTELALRHAKGGVQRSPTGRYAKCHGCMRWHQDLIPTPGDVLLCSRCAAYSGASPVAPAKDEGQLLQPGDWVRHKHFGDGLVRSALCDHGDQEVEVEFSTPRGPQVKKLLLSFSGLHKIEPAATSQ